MKEKSSKQSKKAKPAVQIKDLKPTKDAVGKGRSDDAGGGYYRIGAKLVRG
jgi:hypothetical protein